MALNGQLYKIGHKQGKDGYDKPKVKCQSRTCFRIKKIRDIKALETHETITLKYC